MTLSSINKVRLRSSDKSVITRETVTGDGVDKYFKLGHSRLSADPAPQVRVNDSLKTETTDYTVDYANGVITFTATPAQGDEIEFIYYWMLFSDDEIQDFLDDAGGSIPIATAKVLLAIAADASKIAQRKSMAGGGGLGSVTDDTSVTARELRATAQAILDMEAKAGETIPAEGLTEPIWTEFGYRQSTDQDILRNS